MNIKLQNTLKPTLLLITFLILLGATFYLLNMPIFWGGFIAILFFYAGIFFVGAYAKNFYQSGSVSETLIAGRNIPLFISVFTMSATWIDGGYVNGTAEYTASAGLAWVQAPWGYAISLIIGGIFFAKKMRRYRFTTMLDPLEQRFGKNMAGALFLPALLGEIFWTAAILTALGTTFATVLHVNFNTAIILSALIGIAYTSIGGLWAVAFTDVVQLLFLFFGLYCILPFILPKVGGLSVLIQEYTAQKGDLAWFFPPINGWQHPSWGNQFFKWIDYALLLMFGGIPWQVYFQRILSAKNEQTAMWLSIFSGLVCLLAAVPPIIIGMVGSVVKWEQFGVIPPDSAVLTLPYVIQYLTNPIVATIGLGAVAAAVMSSVDASILSASSMATWNIYRPLFKPQASAAAISTMLKRCIWIVGIAATILALQVKSVYVLWFLCSDLVYCILFPQLLTALFFKKANRYGSIAGYAVGLFLRLGGGEQSLGLPNFLPYPMVENGEVLFPFRTFAMLCGLLSIVLVSISTQRHCPPNVLKIVEN